MRDGSWTDAPDLLILLVGLGSLAAMLLSAEGGRALSRWRSKRAKRKPDESEPSVAQEGYLLGAVLGTFGLLLAFTFGMVINRYETRRQLVVKEANAIGTAYLRAQLLDEPYRAHLSRLLVEYTANRVKLASTANGGGAYLATNDRLLVEIWATVRSARESAMAHGLTTALLTAFNEVIDLDTERKVAWDLRLPPEILTLLIGYLIITSAVVGYQIDGPRGRRAAIVLFVLLALSMAVMADINRPLSGQSRESQVPMLMLLQSLRGQPPAVFDQNSADGQDDRR